MGLGCPSVCGQQGPNLPRKGSGAARAVLTCLVPARTLPSHVAAATLSWRIRVLLDWLPAETISLLGLDKTPIALEGGSQG